MNDCLNDPGWRCWMTLASIIICLFVSLNAPKAGISLEESATTATWHPQQAFLESSRSEPASKQLNTALALRLAKNRSLFAASKYELQHSDDWLVRLTADPAVMQTRKSGISHPKYAIDGQAVRQTIHDLLELENIELTWVKQSRGNCANRWTATPLLDGRPLYGSHIIVRTDCVNGIYQLENTIPKKVQRATILQQSVPEEKIKQAFQKRGGLFYRTRDVHYLYYKEQLHPVIELGVRTETQETLYVVSLADGLTYNQYPANIRASAEAWSWFPTDAAEQKACAHNGTLTYATCPTPSFPHARLLNDLITQSELENSNLKVRFAPDSLFSDALFGDPVTEYLPGSYQYPEELWQFSAVQAYIHANLFEDKLHSLDLAGTELNVLDAQTLLKVNRRVGSIYDLDAGVSTVQTNTIEADYYEDALTDLIGTRGTVFLHELSHVVQFDINYWAFYRTEQRYPRAVLEGIADYLSTSFFGDVARNGRIMPRAISEAMPADPATNPNLDAADFIRKANGRGAIAGKWNSEIIEACEVRHGPNQITDCLNNLTDSQTELLRSPLYTNLPYLQRITLADDWWHLTPRRKDYAFSLNPYQLGTVISGILSDLERVVGIDTVWAWTLLALDNYPTAVLGSDGSDDDLFVSIKTASAIRGDTAFNDLINDAFYARRWSLRHNNGYVPTATSITLNSEEAIQDFVDTGERLASPSGQNPITIAENSVSVSVLATDNDAVASISHQLLVDGRVINESTGPGYVLSANQIPPEGAIYRIIIRDRVGLRRNYSRGVIVSPNASPILSVSPSQIEQTRLQSRGGVFITVGVQNIGNGELQWTALSSRAWASLSQAGGTVGPNQTQEINVSLDVSSLTLGAYDATLTFTSGNQSEVIPVALNIIPGDISPQQLSLSIDQDTYISNPGTNQSYGDEPAIRVRNEGLIDKTFGLAQFDITPLADEESVESARLELYIRGNDTSEDMTVRGSRDPWGESSTWNDVHPIQTFGFARERIDPSASFSLYIFDVTDEVNDWLRGRENNNGFRIALEDDVNGRGTFEVASRENSTSSLRPALRVERLAPNPDLELRRVEISPSRSEYFVGQTVSVSFEAINNGPGVSEETSVDYLFEGSRFNGDQIELIYAGETDGGSESYTFAAGDLGLGRSFTVNADPDGVIPDDQNLANNSQESATFRVVEGPNLAVSPTTLSWDMQANEIPESQSFTVGNSVAGTGDINWTASSESDWIILDKIQGTATPAISSSVNVSVDADHLPDGVSTGTITIRGQYDFLVGIINVSVLKHPCSPPGAFSLVAPADGFSAGAGASILLDWEDAAEAAQYRPSVQLVGSLQEPRVTVTQESQWNISNLEPDQQYEWQVTAISQCGASTTSESRTFTVLPPDQVCEIPEPVTLAGPANGSILADPSPSLTWDASLGANEYEILVDNDQDFSSPVRSQIVGERTWTVSPDLVNGVWYWRVRGLDTMNGCDQLGEWSASRTFEVDTVAPVAPTLLSPSNGSVTFDTTPSFDWTDVLDATQYVIEIDDTPTFSSSPAELIELALTDRSDYTLQNRLETLVTYYWRIYSIDRAGNESAPSQTWSFSLEPAPDFPVPDLLSVEITPSAVTQGEPVTITIRGANLGAITDEGALNVSVLYADGSDNLSVSNVSAPWATWLTSAAPGDAIFDSNCQSMSAVDHMVEAAEDNWQGAEEHSLSFTVVPNQEGTLLVRARTTMKDDSAGAACSYINDTSVAGTSSTDQQGWAAVEREIIVSSRSAPRIVFANGFESPLPVSIQFAELPNGQAITTDTLLAGDEFYDRGILVSGDPSPTYCQQATAAAIRVGPTSCGIERNRLSSADPNNIDSCGGSFVRVEFVELKKQVEVTFKGASMDYRMWAYDKDGNLLGSTQTRAVCGGEAQMSLFSSPQRNIHSVRFGRAGAGLHILQIDAL